MSILPRLRFGLRCCLLLVTLGFAAPAQGAPDERVLQAEADRIAAIAKASKATVAVFDGGGQGGGSAVIISPDGFALTNFHVVQPCGVAMKCGLSDGVLYDAVLVSIDPVGDVALIQLLGRDDFPVAEIADSDNVEVGDWAFAAGNPFLLADDFTPTITYGMISGVRRYQYPAGTLLEYTDCLQTDAAINPGNSGGPLFNAHGKLIGINGRGSFEKRGRVNVGVGYAISVNQTMRFLGHLKSGRIVDHASLGATVTTTNDGEVRVDDILESSDAYRRGLRYDDAILRFADRELTSANDLQNVLGTFPRGWTVPIAFRHESATLTKPVRLLGVHGESELADMLQQPQNQQPLPDRPSEPEQPEEKSPLPKLPDLEQVLGKKPKLPSAVAKRYQQRRGYANYWYNLQEQKRLWNHFQEQIQLAGMGYHWKLAGKLPSGDPFELATTGQQARLTLPWGEFRADFRSSDFASEGESLLSPPGSGGLLAAIHLLQRFAEKGLRQFGEVYYLGKLPVGEDLKPADCLVGLAKGTETRFFFDSDRGDLVALEFWPTEDTDPCVIQFSDYGTFSGRRLPARWQVVQGTRTFAEFQVSSWSNNSDGSSNTDEEP